jgi:hypothetical protein
MPGTIPGRVYKHVISAMLESISAPEFALLKRRLAEMDPELRYPWDDYTDLMQTLAAKLPAESLVNLGRHIITQGQERIRAGGFASGEQVMKDWGTLFNMDVRGAPARDLVRTESFEPGRVTVLAGIVQPAPLVEGYLRGIVDAFELGTVTSCDISSVIIGGASYNRLVLRWQ